MSKRKTRRNGREEVSEGTSSKDTREIESLTDQDFEDLSNKIERNLSRKLKEQDDARDKLWDMMDSMKAQMELLVKAKAKELNLNSLTEPLTVNVEDQHREISGNTPLLNT